MRGTLLPGLLRAGSGRSPCLEIAGRRSSPEALLDAAAGVAARVAGAPAVAVDAEAGPEAVVAVVGGLLAGVPVVPVPADAGPAEIAHVLSDSGAVLALARPGRLERFEPFGEVRPMAVDLAPGGGACPLPPEPPGDRPALVLYTSGTTGPPKGVVITRDAIAADLDGLADAWGWTAEDTVVHGLPLSHVHGLVLGVLGPLRVGGGLIHTGRPSGAGYAAAVAAGGTMCFGVPTVWSRIASGPDAEGLAAARLLVSGSALLPAPVDDAVAARTGHRLLQRYGMTETLITLAARSDRPPPPGSVGQPLPGVEARVLDEEGAPVPADGVTVGALEVRGATLMAGYLGRPEETAACFSPDGWFRTGDLASVGGDGSHRILGRASSDLIKTGGYRVGAGEVEAALLSHPGVREAAVVGEPDPDLGQVIVAYVVADGAPAHQLTTWVAEHLSAHKRPRRVHLVDALPTNELGKVQKGRLRPPA